MTVAQMVAVYPMIRIAIGAVWDTIIGNASVIAEYLGQIKDALDTLTVSENQTETLQQQTLKNPGGDIVLSRVHFAYPGSGVHSLHDFTLQIKGGQKLGIVGVSGAGKTTLAHILMGLYEAQKGHIEVGGRR